MEIKLKWKKNILESVSYETCVRWICKTKKRRQWSLLKSGIVKIPMALQTRIKALRPKAYKEFDHKSCVDQSGARIT